jgi:hypothetical protein
MWLVPTIQRGAVSDDLAGNSYLFRLEGDLRPAAFASPRVPIAIPRVRVRTVWFERLLKAIEPAC